MISFDVKISDDPYSLSVKAMAEQLLEDFLETLKAIDPSEVQIGSLRKIEFEQAGKMKRILDLSTIIYDPVISTTLIRVALKELKDETLLIQQFRSGRL